MHLDFTTLTLSIAVLGTGLGAIIAAYVSAGRRVFLILKPLTTFLIFVIVVSAYPAFENKYAPLVAVGLLFSLVGDVMLMLPSRYFSAGILSFSVTHALYFSAFALAAGIAIVYPLTPLLVAVAAALALFILPGVKPSLRIPVLLYILLITIMASQAAGAAVEQQTTRLTTAAAGALLFFISDAILAIDRFKSPFRSARTLVLSTYWLGQWLIAVSTRIYPPA